MRKLLFSISPQGADTFKLNKPSLELGRDECTYLNDSYTKRRAKVVTADDSPAEPMDIYVFTMPGGLEAYYVLSEDL